MNSEGVASRVSGGIGLLASATGQTFYKAGSGSLAVVAAQKPAISLSAAL